MDEEGTAREHQPQWHGVKVPGGEVEVGEYAPGHQDAGQERRVEAPRSGHERQLVHAHEHRCGHDRQVGPWRPGRVPEPEEAEKEQAEDKGRGDAHGQVPGIHLGCGPFHQIPPKRRSRWA